MIAHPNAKINIGLYITGQRENGYHDLETIFYPIPLHDILEIKPLSGSSSESEFQIVGMPANEDYRKNLVFRVYTSLQEEFGLPPLSFYLKKNIPTGAGLGGGSSDAASTLLMLNEMFELNLNKEEMKQRMACFGADCPFFIENKAAFATELGEILQPLDFSLRGTFLLLVKPRESVSTAEAYARIAPHPASTDLKKAVEMPIEKWSTCIGNDFEPVVFSMHPSIDAIKSTLYDMGALYAQMSGSGSAVFGLFKRPTPEARHIFTNCFVYNKNLL